MVIVAINDNGEEIRQAKLPTSTRSLEDFFGSFGEPVRAVVECTSNWYWLSDWCRDNDIDLTLAHAKMVKAISYAKVKTDKVDAKTLAELLRAGLIPEAYQITPERLRVPKAFGACAGLGNRPAGRLKIWDSSSAGAAVSVH